jgi:hypothetical protein
VTSTRDVGVKRLNARVRRITLEEWAPPRPRGGAGASSTFGRPRPRPTLIRETAMSRLVSVSLAVLAGVLIASAGRASAQGGYPYGPPRVPAYGPGYRPGLSPYLNLNRGGDPAVNYYLGTIPEFQRRANAQLFSSQIAGLEARPPAVVGGASPDADLFTPLPATGHLTAFQNTAAYFPGGVRPGGVTAARPVYQPPRPTK